MAPEITSEAWREVPCLGPEAETPGVSSAAARMLR